MTIIVSKGGKNAKRVERSSFDQEDYLQKYIYDNPESIPLYEIKDDIRLLILSREFPTNSGPIDALGIDKDGEIYIIETKLYKNSDKRTVVAQILDYGASLWSTYKDFSEFTRILDNETNTKFGHSLNQRIKAFFMMEDNDSTIEQLFDSLKQNLADANFKFVVLMDNLDTRLKDLIVFVNQNSQFNIFAVQFDYYKYDNQEIIIPKLYGAEVKKSSNISSPRSSKVWNEATFFEAARSILKQEQVEAIIKLYDFVKIKADEIVWGKGQTYGSFNPKFYRIGSYSPMSITSKGLIWLNFPLNRGDEQTRLNEWFRASMSKVIGRQIPDNKTYEQIEIDEWAKHVDEVIRTIADMER